MNDKQKILIGILLVSCFFIGLIVGYQSNRYPKLSRYELQTYEELKYFYNVKDYLPLLFNEQVETIFLDKDYYVIFYPDWECDRDKRVRLHYTDWKKYPQKILNSF